MNSEMKLFARLTKRENEVLHWVSAGKTYWEISVILGIKETTVKFHMGNVVRKLGVCSAKQAIRARLNWNLAIALEVPYEILQSNPHHNG